MMDKGGTPLVDVISRTERRKRDPIGQILDFLSNSSRSSTADDTMETEPACDRKFSLCKSTNVHKTVKDERTFQVDNIITKTAPTYCLEEESKVLDEGSAFKPFSKNCQEISNIATNGKFCLQNSLPVVNAYGNSHMYGVQHAAIPVTTSTIYGLPGFPFQYPTIPNTVPHTIMPKMPFMFPQNYGFCSTFDSSRNMNMFWLGKKIAAESSFNPACILNSESTGNRTTHTPPRYQCESCKKSYSTYGGLSKHKQFHCVNQVKKEFSCKFCGKCYGSLGALKMHIRTHTLPCKCKICGKAFSRPWLLQGHIRTHTGEKPFRCDHCTRAFADRSNLRAHLQTHSEVKKYGCKSCNKTFSRMSLLVKHKENHCYR